MNYRLRALFFGVLAAPAAADIVHVRVDGAVEFNQVRSGIFAGIGAGAPVAIEFDLDTGVFRNGVNSPTRGYFIVAPSFRFTVGTAVAGLQISPPEGPLFVLRDNDPQVDGFFLGTDPDAGFPDGVALDEPGRFGQFRSNFSVTYEGSRLRSLSIRDAGGAYNFTGLQVFSFSLVDGGSDAMGIVFEQMTISPAPGAAAVLAPLALVAVRRRR